MPTTGPRYAISYTPPPFSRLAQFGAAVLGYDCFHGVECPQVPLPGIDPALLSLMTIELRHYGFQAAIVAPFRLGAQPVAAVMDALGVFAKERGPRPMGPLEVATVGRHVALRPTDGRQGIATLAAQCLAAFDRFRNSTGSRGRDTAPFHLPLAGPVPDEQAAPVRKALAAAYQELANNRFEFDTLSLLRQDDSEARFRVIERYRLRGEA